MILHGEDALRALVQGACLSARAIAVTYGPLGRTVFIERLSGLIHTKDGATVAADTALPDPAMNLGAQVVKSACMAVNDKTGDGTTATAILTASLLVEGVKALRSGQTPQTLCRELREACTKAIEVLRYMAVPVTEPGMLERVAMVSSNYDAPMAKLLKEAAMAVGRDGLILIEDGYGVDDEIEFVNGCEVSAGWSSVGYTGSYFINDSDGQCVHHDDVLVAVVAEPLTSYEDVASMMEEASTYRPHDSADPDPVLILAPVIEAGALETFHLNAGYLSSRMRDPKKKPRYVPVVIPGTRWTKRDHLMDVAALSGATLVDPGAGMSLRDFDREWLGALRKVAVYEDRSILEGYEENLSTLQQRVRMLKVQRDQCSSDYDRDRLDERIGSLSGGLCKIRVGGVTEAETKERRARIEDALSSVRCALENGIVPGGGMALMTAAEDLDVHTPGADVLKKAMLKPFDVLTRGLDLSVAVDRARREDDFGWVGVDLTTRTVRDLAMDPLVSDPADTVCASIQHAVSAATTLLLSQAVVTRP